MPRTLMIMAGGTGGHVFPGLAVAERLRAAGWRIVWLGSRAGIEARLVPARGIEIEWVDFAGLRGKGMMAMLLLPYRLLRAFWDAARVILRQRPDVVLGMGGFQSFPGGMMAAFLGRPLAIHEQNSVAGLANKVLARLSDRVMSAFPNVLKNAATTGNPVRSEISQLPDPRDRYQARTGALQILVMGGSLGAKVLNDTLPDAIARLPAGSRPRLVHQSGKGHLDGLRARYAAAGVEAEAVEFIEDVAKAMAEADLVICRAGALTVAELACAGVASVLVPYPFAVDDHQTGNARFLADAGAAILLPQTRLNADSLAELLGNTSRGQLADMAVKARARAIPDATERLARVCEELAA
jgi:UDP-N-acetylglucosamine--N-acetylmuramyl-(pentapeptide) pyrophosphoryl-undecaprenol N-acetylglucosamine transferase